MAKIKDFIKSLELDLSDVLLAVGFLFSVVFYAFPWLFMVTANPDDLVLKPWMFIICFIVTMGCWAGYLYLQHRKGNLPHPAVSAIFFIAAVTGLIAVLVQPSTSIIEVVMREVNATNSIDYPGHSAGDIITVTAVISDTHRAFFAMCSVTIIEIFYIIFFVFPKRFKTVKFLYLMTIAVFIFLFVVVGYSYVVERDHYIPFIQSMLKGDMDGVYANSVQSFMAHRVPYGVCMMLGIGMAICLHSFTKKWYLYLLMAFYYINMVFSYCKSSLIYSALLIFAYVIFRLIFTYKEHEKRNKIMFISIGGLIVLALLLGGISYISKGKVLSPIYKIITSVTEAKTIDSRSYIWDNTYHLLSGGWWVIGRGFGTYNEMLYLMNIVNGDYVCPSHSTYNALMGQGGIIHLLAFLTLYVYYFYTFIKCLKRDRYQTIAFSLPIFAFLLYSLTEGVHHLILTFMFPMFLLNATLNRKEEGIN